MNKIQIDQLLKPLISIYDEIELELIRNIIQIIDNYDGVKGSLAWYIDRLNEISTLNKLNIKSLNKKEIKKVLIDIMKQSSNDIYGFERLETYHNKGLIDINPNELYNSIAVNTLVTEAINDIDDIKNLIETKALEGARECYRDVLNKAYVETASGVYSYQEAIRRALKEYAKTGIKTVHYESGKSLSIESVVRRDVITRINKLVGDTVIEHANELGTNLIYVDQHLGARVRTKYTKHDYEAHAEWQGKKYMINGSDDKYDNLYEKTGYGEMLGLKGINCYHNMRPTWEWEEIPDTIDEVENKRKYELLEEQRSFERKIRRLKREREIAKALNDNEEYKKIKGKLTSTNKEFDIWLSNNNLTRDYSREYTPKFKEFIPIFEEEYFKEFENLDMSIEHLIVYNKDTGVRVGKVCSGVSNHVQPDFKTTIKLLTAKKDSLIVTHNHPSNTSFSLRDIKTFNETPSIGIISVRTDDYIYALSGTKVKDIKILEKAHRRIKKKVQKENLNIIEERHKINTLLAKEMGWKYARFKNNSNN